MAGMQGSSIKYNGAIDALTSILRVEGVAGLYRGLWPNLRELPFSSCCRFFWRSAHCFLLLSTVKVAPSIATSFFTYELVCFFFLVWHWTFSLSIAPPPSQVKEFLVPP